MQDHYHNPRTGLNVSLESLSDAQRQFFAEAMERFRANCEWLAFDEFAFGARSPIYEGRRSHQDVLRSPLYLALRDMSLQLGVQQGKVAANRPAQHRSEGVKAIA